MTRLSASSLRDTLAEALNKVAYGGERILLHRRGKDLAALISKDDLALFEELEDRSDAILAHEALAEPGAIPWEKVREDLDL
jgi:prevent-host-death family protein